MVSTCIWLLKEELPVRSFTVILPRGNKIGWAIAEAMDDFK